MDQAEYYPSSTSTSTAQDTLGTSANAAQDPSQGSASAGYVQAQVYPSSEYDSNQISPSAVYDYPPMYSSSGSSPSMMYSRLSSRRSRSRRSRRRRRRKAKAQHAPVALVGAFGSLVAILCIGVYLAFSTGDARRYYKHSGGGNDSSSRIGSKTSNGAAGSNTSIPFDNATWISVETTTVAASYRKGIMFCVLGQSFTVVDPITAGWCDYTIYPDLTVVNDGFQPLYKRSTWDKFREGLAKQKSVAPGVSFSLGQSDAATTIPAMGGQLSDLVRTVGVRAMGVLNYARHSSPNTNIMAPMFKAFTTALASEPGLVPMTFLGVWLYTHKAAAEFVSEVLSMQENLDTIILQTHMSEIHASPSTCISRPICVMSSVDTLPSFSIAEAVVTSLREESDKLRLLFSSTLGVMLYAGAPGTDQPSGADRPCAWSYMEDYNFVCNDSVLSGKRLYDSAGKYEYVSYEEDDRMYYVTFESNRSIVEKYQMYIPNTSEGWALFDIQRDVGAKCSPFGLNYERLETAQSIARNRTHVL